ncbi:hypothetical protein ACFXAS_24335 [Streptomyces sp. NPDC059459]|uniref:hypothetical protein n=1 Tax=Streptomyces sp. NPDC059459 TaxID=3346839 RepID=UPI00367FFECE
MATSTADEVESTPVPLLFGGQAGIDIVIGATALSNEVDLLVSPGQSPLVKVYLPGECQPKSAVLPSTDLPTDHPLYYPQPEWWRADLSSEGDFTDVVGLPDATRSHHVPFLYASTCWLADTSRRSQCTARPSPTAWTSGLTTSRVD